MRKWASSRGEIRARSGPLIRSLLFGARRLRGVIDAHSNHSRQLGTAMASQPPGQYGQGRSERNQSAVRHGAAASKSGSDVGEVFERQPVIESAHGNTFVTQRDSRNQIRTTQ